MVHSKSIAFCTYVSDQYYHSFGADKLVRSAKYFYPDIPFYVYGSVEINEICQPVDSLHPFMMSKLAGLFDIVVYFDADSVITGNIDQVFDALEKFEVVCVRNNNDDGKAGMNAPISQQNRDINIYVNAGMVATSSTQFINDWMAMSKLFGELVPFGAQTVLNAIIDQYRWTLIDAIDQPIYYGVSALSGEATHWDSWKEIVVVEGQLFLNGKTVKVLHHAGGFIPDKLGLYMFNDETRKRLIEIIYQ